MSNKSPSYASRSFKAPQEELCSIPYQDTKFSEPAGHVTCCLPEKRESFFQRKYLVDRWLGGVLLILTSPLTLTLFVLVKLTSRGPGFYRQKRVGLNGHRFDVVKLRTMNVSAESHGEAIWCVKNDARITTVGRILRALHLDELPQLYNVLQGDMTLIGPRPERPQICQRLAQQIDGYCDRNVVKPGITGLAQINLPADTTIDCVRKKQVLDLSYIQEANPWLDTRILIITTMYLFGFHGETIIKWMGLCRQDLLSEQSDNSISDDDNQRSVCDTESALVLTNSYQDDNDDIETTSLRRPR